MGILTKVNYRKNGSIYPVLTYIRVFWYMVTTRGWWRDLVVEP